MRGLENNTVNIDKEFLQKVINNLIVLDAEVTYLQSSKGRYTCTFVKDIILKLKILIGE